MLLYDTRSAVLAALCLSMAGGGGGEYVVVSQGTAPNGRFSVPGHRKIGPLEQAPVGVRTEPDAYGALWTADSRHVAVTYATNHFADVVLFRVRNGRAYPVIGPTPWGDITARNRALFQGVEPARDYVTLTWLGPARFRLMELRDFDAPAPTMGKALGRFGRATRQDDAISPAHRYAIQFSAAALCELTRGDKYRIVRLQPGRFD